MKSKYHGARPCRILVINPGSTSTKIAVYDNENELVCVNIEHPRDELSAFDAIFEQYEFRLRSIEKFLEAQSLTLDSFQCIVGRGGLIRSIPSGVYAINELMLHDLRLGKRGEHASNLGAALAYFLAKKISQVTPSYILDPVIVDEMEPFAKLTGHPQFPKQSIFHALGQKAVARSYAQSVSKKYEDLNIIVAYMGGGISVGLHHQGRVVDVNNALDGTGPMTPERSGTMPWGEVLKASTGGQYTLPELKKMFKGAGGLMAHLGTADAREVEKRIEQGDEKAQLIYKAMSYQISKEIASLAVYTYGKIDAIILTGGLAKSDWLTTQIKARTEFLAPVVINKGENEMSALATGALEAYQGTREIWEY